MVKQDPNVASAHPSKEHKTKQNKTPVARFHNECIGAWKKDKPFRVCKRHYAVKLFYLWMIGSDNKCRSRDWLARPAGHSVHIILCVRRPRS